MSPGQLLTRQAVRLQVDAMPHGPSSLSSSRCHSDGEHVTRPSACSMPGGARRASRGHSHTPGSAGSCLPPCLAHGALGALTACSSPAVSRWLLGSSVASELWFPRAAQRVPPLLQVMQGCTGGHLLGLCHSAPEGRLVSPVFPAGVMVATEGSRKRSF